MPSEMEEIYRQAICRAEEGKAAGPDGVPMEILKICPQSLRRAPLRAIRGGSKAEVRDERLGPFHSHPDL